MPSQKAIVELISFDLLALKNKREEYKGDQPAGRQRWAPRDEIEH
jgi:hypothetical protein